MDKSDNVILAYVDGSDLHEIASELEGVLSSFVASREWHSGEAGVVNQVAEKGANEPAEFLPHWEMGLNFHIPNRSSLNQDWTQDVQATVDFLSCLAVKCQVDSMC